MKRAKSLICLALAVWVLLSLNAAAAATGRSYTVSVSGGLYGLVNGAQRSEKAYAPGENFRPEDFTVTVTNEKYVFTGFYVSGQERPFGAQPITQDVELMARYALKAETAQISLRCRTAAGTPLRGDELIRVKLGESAVVHAPHIDGYTPDAYSRSLFVTGEGETSFLYTPLPTPQSVRRIPGEQSERNGRPQREEIR